MSIILYLSAKAHANHSRSPTAAQINAMINADTISEVESILQATSYGSLLNDVRPSVDLPGFEVALRREYARLLHVYRNAATGVVQKMLNAFAVAIDAENMDMIFQAIIRDNVDEDLEQIIIPVGKFGLRHYKRIMENTEPMVATDYILDSDIRVAAQKALKQSNDPDEQIFLLSSALSHKAYSLLGEVAPKWIKLEADFMNLKTICRALNLGITVEDWLIPNIGSVYKQRQYLMNLGSPREVLSYMSSRFATPRPILASLDAKDPVATFEDKILEFLYYQRYRNFMLYGNRNQSILDYFSIKHAEISDITRILTSKILSHTDESDLRNMMYPIYKRA